MQAAFFVYLALYLQQGRGLNPLEAGLVFTILAVAYVVTSGPAPKLVARYGRVVVARRRGDAGRWAGGARAWRWTRSASAARCWRWCPGLALVGAGIGLCFTPIQQLVLGGIDPARAGAASGMLSTTQQVGFALGVAITGVIYFGAADQGIAHAFEVSLWQMAAFAVEIVALTRLLPRPERRSAATAAEPALATGN